MSRFKVLGAVATTIMVTGCTYNVQTLSAPQLNVYSNYSNRVPNRWALVVDPQSLPMVAKSSSLQCAAHNFPLDLRGTFRSSVSATFENVVEELEVLDRPIPVEELTQQGYAGLIQVRGETVRTRLNFVPGFFMVAVDATVDLDVGLVVDGREGRILGTRASGMGSFNGDAGSACVGGADVLGRASEEAIRSVLGQIAERFANAPRIREANAAVAPIQRAIANEPVSTQSAPVASPVTSSGTP